MGKHRGCIFYILHFSVYSVVVLSEQNECAIGMTGLHCNIPCRYPSYGKGCQSLCYCSKINCNATTGCKDGIKRSTYQTRKSTNAKQLDNVIVPTTGTEACPIGFTGSDCEIKCRFPAYGVLCQSACNCTKDQCNHISGCDATKTKAVTITLTRDLLTRAPNSRKLYHGSTMQSSTLNGKAINSSTNGVKNISGNDNSTRVLKIAIAVLTVIALILIVTYKCVAPLQKKYYFVKSNQASCEELIITDE
ncbi:uncharacterized protein LOC111103531 isoform X1 [Crassostrea virginica]